MAVRRNAFGRQIDSFETELEIPVLGDAPVHAVFIRAPVVESVGTAATPLAALADGRVVAVEQGNLLGTSFHPEITGEYRFHEYFLGKVARAGPQRRLSSAALAGGAAFAVIGGDLQPRCSARCPRRRARSGSSLRRRSRRVDQRADPGASQDSRCTVVTKLPRSGGPRSVREVRRIAALVASSSSAPVSAGAVA